MTAGYTIQTPQLDINTIAAGGGSMLFFRAGMFYVGPESVAIFSILHLVVKTKIYIFFF